MRSFLLLGGLGLALAGAALPLACSSSSLNPASGDAGAKSDAGGAGDDANASTGDAGPPDPTALAENLSLPTGLTLIGSTLYWVENADGIQPTVTNAIRSVAASGGTPSTVLVPTTGNVASALASDGTNLYYAVEFPSTSDASALDTSQIMKSGLDGSNPTVVVASGIPDGYVNAIFIVNGTLYVQAGMGIATASASATGGAATPLHTPGDVQGLYWADATSLYYSVVGGGPLSLAPQGFDFYESPLDGVSPNLLVDLSNDGGTFIFGGVAVGGGNVYLAETLAPTGTILQVPASLSDGGAATPLATLSEWVPGDIVADGSGMYVTQADSNNAAAPLGIYSVSLSSGTPTLVHISPFGAYDLALDASHVYWLEDTATSQVTLHGVAR